MANDDKKAKATPAPKAEAVAPKKAEAPKADTPKADAPKTEANETAAAPPKSYSRGEGQKPVSQAYKDNWNAIFAKKTTKKKKR